MAKASKNRNTWSNHMVRCVSKEERDQTVLYSKEKKT